jgi:hypothetical protein
MTVFAMESVYLRTQKNGTKPAMCSVFLRDSMQTIETAGRTVLAASSEGDALRTNMAVLKRFTKYEPVNSIELRRQIARRLLDAERYTV